MTECVCVCVTESGCGRTPAARTWRGKGARRAPPLCWKACGSGPPANMGPIGSGVVGLQFVGAGIPASPKGTRHAGAYAARAREKVAPILQLCLVASAFMWHTLPSGRARSECRPVCLGAQFPRSRACSDSLERTNVREAPCPEPGWQCPGTVQHRIRKGEWPCSAFSHGMTLGMCAVAGMRLANAGSPPCIWTPMHRGSCQKLVCSLSECPASCVLRIVR